MNKNKKKREYAQQVQDIALMALMDALGDMVIAEQDETLERKFERESAASEFDEVELRSQDEPSNEEVSQQEKLQESAAVQSINDLGV